LSLPELGAGRVIISTHMDRQESVDLGSFTLRSNEGWVIRLD
jgi:hypothetical protein